MFKNKFEQIKFILVDIFDFGKITTPISIQIELVGADFREPFDETKFCRVVRIFGIRIITIQNTKQEGVQMNRLKKWFLKSHS